MKKVIFGTLLLLINLLPNQIQASTLSCSQVDGMSVFGHDYNEWKFIGAISNKYDSNSIANDYGSGSKYNSDSINNDYGSFGGKYSSYSAFNEYTSDAPIIVDDDYKFIGYLTVNKYNTPNINTYEAIACANKSYTSSNSKMEDITFKKIPSSSSYGGTGYSSLPTSCPINSSLTTTGCVCNSGYVTDSTKAYCVVQPPPQLPSCPINSNLGVNNNCYCINGYELAIDKKSCIKTIPIVIKIEKAPTCSISFTPKTITLGKTVTESIQTTGVIIEASYTGTGFLSFSNTVSGDASYFFNLLNSGKTYSSVIKPNEVGETSQTYTVTGPGGSSGCTASFTTTSKSILKDSNNTTLGEIKEKVKTEEKIVPITEPKEEVAPPVNPEPVKKLSWYQKIFNWLFK